MKKIQVILLFCLIALIYLLPIIISSIPLLIILLLGIEPNHDNMTSMICYVSIMIAIFLPAISYMSFYFELFSINRYIMKIILKIVDKKAKLQKMTIKSSINKLMR